MTYVKCTVSYVIDIFFCSVVDYIIVLKLWDKNTYWKLRALQVRTELTNFLFIKTIAVNKHHHKVNTEVFTLDELHFEKLKKNHLRCSQCHRKDIWERQMSFSTLNDVSILNAQYLGCLSRTDLWRIVSWQKNGSQLREWLEVMDTQTPGVGSMAQCRLLVIVCLVFSDIHWET